MNETEKVHCLIIGSGPAGYTAAIYAARANLKPVLYQGMQPGGQLTITTEVENYPGYPNGIMGPQMMVDFEQQAQRMGADIRWGMATKVDFSVRPFKVEIDEEKWIEADSVIIATGASAKWLGLESEQRLNGHGVSACAVCDGFFFKNQEVAIVGAGQFATQIKPNGDFTVLNLVTSYVESGNFSIAWDTTAAASSSSRYSAALILQTAEWNPNYCKHPSHQKPTRSL